MDAYDIFKKLSRGAKFSGEYNPKRNKNVESIKIEKSNEDQPKQNVQARRREKDDNPITLLSTLKTNTESRGKKRKHSNEHNDERKQKLLKEEEINHYRNLNRITVVGRHVPEPLKTFDEFPVGQSIIDNLKNCGYEEPTPVQKQAIPIMLQVLVTNFGRHLLACAPTGSGKTAAFLVPIINDLKRPRKNGFRALILCPTRELAKQTQRECLRLSEGKGFRVHVISKINKALTQYGTNSSQKFDILITTPNRLCFLLKQDPPALSLANIKWLIIDEADKLFETGNRGFREQLDQVVNACTNPERKIAMFSATYTPVVAKWCVHNMKALIRITVGQRNAATDLVDQELLFVGNEQGKLLAFRELVRKGLSPPVLIFVQSKDRAQQLFNELIYDGINVDAIHADRTQLQRDNTVRSFREGRIWILICTELMARGIDFKGAELDVQEEEVKQLLFSQWKTHIAHILNESGCEVPSYMLTMKKKTKKERKQLEKAAPKRDDISTRPKYENVKTIKR
ncbi:ATP-dependent RNA helicase DDX52, partial [Asbolus verrucosus]